MPRCLLLSLLLLCSSPAHADWSQEITPALLAGQGDYQFLGMPIYTARLWVAEKPFDPAHRFALSLTYHHHITKSRLINTSLDEIQRIKGSALPTEKLAAWRAALEQAIDEVEVGDSLTGVYLPDVGVDFYHNGRLTAAIKDADFARSFFAIWLSVKSRDANLRSHLLGSAQ